MSPRPYRLGQRQAAIDETRARVIGAARELLVCDKPGRFSIEAVAQRADVARATVYYQFRSKLGLLEALFDSVAAAGGMAGLADAFGRSEPLAALDEYIAVFGRFWGSDRRLHRRLHGLAAVDPDLGAALQARAEWRRRGAATLVSLAHRPAWIPARRAAAGRDRHAVHADQLRHLRHPGWRGEDTRGRRAARPASRPRRRHPARPGHVIIHSDRLSE